MCLSSADTALQTINTSSPLNYLPLLCCPASQTYMPEIESSKTPPKCLDTPKQVELRKTAGETPKIYSHWKLPLYAAFSPFAVNDTSKADLLVALFKKDPIVGFRLAKNSDGKYLAGFSTELICKQAAVNLILPKAEITSFASVPVAARPAAVSALFAKYAYFVKCTQPQGITDLWVPPLNLQNDKPDTFYEKLTELLADPPIAPSFSGPSTNTNSGGTNATFDSDATISNNATTSTVATTDDTDDTDKTDIWSNVFILSGILVGAILCTSLLASCGGYLYARSTSNSSAR